MRKKDLHIFHLVNYLRCPFAPDVEATKTDKAIAMRIIVQVVVSLTFPLSSAFQVLSRHPFEKFCASHLEARTAQQPWYVLILKLIPEGCSTMFMFRDTNSKNQNSTTDFLYSNLWKPVAGACCIVVLSTLWWTNWACLVQWSGYLGQPSMQRHRLEQHNTFLLD